MMPYHQLNICERKVIKKMLKKEKSIREIARIIDCHPSTISREIKRNSDTFWYNPISAQTKYLDRRKKSKVRIIDQNNELKEHIVRELKLGKSPDAISGRLKLTHKKCPKMKVSHETIYSWIYAHAKNGDDLYKHLPRKIRKRNRRCNKYKPRIHIPDRISIHERSSAIESRRYIGHWEGDTIVGKGHQGYIATIVERKSYFLAAGLMTNKRPETCNRAIMEAFWNIQNKSIKSMTFDNGTEFYNHKDLQEAFECSIYFADPYSAWQRGINENTNGIIRRFFPKSLDFKNLTQNDVDEVVKKINNIPRKSLGYRTPYEVFYNLSVALQT